MFNVQPKEMKKKIKPQRKIINSNECLCMSVCVCVYNERVSVCVVVAANPGPGKEFGDLA